MYQHSKRISLIANVKGVKYISKLQIEFKPTPSPNIGITPTSTSTVVNLQPTSNNINLQPISPGINLQTFKLLSYEMR